MSNTLIITTRYDRESTITRQWAERLGAQLLALNRTTIMVDGSVLGQAALQDLLAFADQVVFFGHGSRDALIARPGKGALAKDTALVDAQKAGTLLGSLPVYAVCCDARVTFGPACAGGFVGYDCGFPIKAGAEKEFGDVVVGGGVAFASGISVSTLASQLKQDWLDLAYEFDHGLQLQHHPDAQWGKTAAEDLARGIGKAP